MTTITVTPDEIAACKTSQEVMERTDLPLCDRVDLAVAAAAAGKVLASQIADRRIAAPPANELPNGQEKEA